MNDSFQKRWSEWQQKIDVLQTRERVLLFAVAVVVIIVLVQMLLIEPVIKKKELLSRQHQQLTDTIAQQRINKQQLEIMLVAGVNKAKIAHRDKLKIEHAQLDAKIQSSILTLIPPKLMPLVLEKVLVENDKLKLLSLENKPVVALVTQVKKPVNTRQRKDLIDGSESSPASETQGLYKHSFVLRLEGSYPAAIEYFEALSELPWRFNWDALHYEVISYPKASISLEIHTVSMSEDWIGV